MDAAGQAELGVDALAQVASLRALIQHGRSFTNVLGEHKRRAARYPTAAVSTAERQDPFFAVSKNHAKGLKRAWNVFSDVLAELMPVPAGLTDEQLDAETIVLAGTFHWTAAVDCMARLMV